ncbi:MAG: phosphodiesterase [Massilia sp.]|nr:phosphodiesterase [Massilia sp.]
MENPDKPDDQDDDDWLIDDDADADADAETETETDAGIGFGERRAQASQRPWRVLVVDDDADVHAVTRLALRNVSFKGRELDLFSAHSAAEGFQQLRDSADIALVLLDVVMETEDAGLALARRIREELGNHSVRLVLRTGQPGQAPEQRVIVDYDINDYKAKTELTTQRLFTAVISALRAYETLTVLERTRAGLARILAATPDLHHAAPLRQFASSVLAQVRAVFDVGAGGMACLMDAGGAGPVLLAATGEFPQPDAQADPAEPALLPAGHPLLAAFARALHDGASQYEPQATLFLLRTRHQQRLCLAVSPPPPVAPEQRDLLELYWQRLAAAFDNQYLFDQLRMSGQAGAGAGATPAEAGDPRNPGPLDSARLLPGQGIRQFDPDVMAAPPDAAGGESGASGPARS